VNSVSCGAVQSELPLAKGFLVEFKMYKILLNFYILVLIFYYKYTKLLIAN